MLTCRSRCDRQFKSMAAMDQHYKASHGTFICRKGCRREFKTSLGRMGHEEEFHAVPRTQTKPVTKLVGCSDCEKDFATWEALRQHQSTSVNHTRLTSAPGTLQCSECARTLRSQDAVEQHFGSEHPLLLISKNYGEGPQLERHFRQQWLKGTSVPNVLFMYKIYNPGWRTLRFKEYKASLPNQGNVVRRYHGTTVQCQLGTGIPTKLCRGKACGLCGIISSGFKTAKARSGWQRFGRGIYTTETTSKSDDYVKTMSPRRAVLVCDVAAGNPFRTKVSMSELRGPPEGFDSVSGEVGMDLNYDELVIYKSKAILPRFLIVYHI